MNVNVNSHVWFFIYQLFLIFIFYIDPDLSVMPPEFVENMHCFENVAEEQDLLLGQFPMASILFIFQEKQVGFGAFRGCLKHFTKVGLTSLSFQLQVKR